MRITVDRLVAIVLGLVVGYLVWLAAMSIVTFLVPPRFLVVAGIVIVIVIIAAAATLATRFARRGRKATSLAFWCVPILSLIHI